MTQTRVKALPSLVLRRWLIIIDASLYFCCPFSRCDVRLRGGSFVAVGPIPSGWFKFVVNFIGPNNGEGIRIYINGEQVGSDPKMVKHRPHILEGDGRIVIGRWYTSTEFRYSSQIMDDLLLFNHALSNAEIQRLSAIVEPFSGLVFSGRIKKIV